MIVSSKVIEDMPQTDGRRSVRERHVDDDGNEFEVFYLAEEDAKPDEILPLRAAQIEEQLEEKRLAKEAEQIAEKDRAASLLKLADGEIKAILKLDHVDEVAEEKTKLAILAAGGN